MSTAASNLYRSLMRHEGFRAQPYVCPSGRASIGFGHNLEADPRPIKVWSENVYQLAKGGALRGEELVRRLLVLGMIWDPLHAKDWLRQDVERCAEALGRCCPVYVRLSNLVAAEHAGKSEGALEDMSPLGLAAHLRCEVLLEMAFNLGVQGLLNFRRMFLALEREDYDLAASEMLQSRWAGQVGPRAVRLARMMRRGEICS